MKTAKELLDKRLTINNGFHKGATVTISRKAIEELMEEYHAQYELTDDEIYNSIPYTELRIGNWYLSTKFQVPVICEMGDFYEIYARADGSTEYTVDDIFQSIPLTEEWLLKFGFIESIFCEDMLNQNDGDRCFVPENPDDYMYISYGDNSMYCIVSYGGIKYIKYVHQLQNLYFALTGEELKIN